MTTGPAPTRPTGRVTGPNQPSRGMPGGSFFAGIIEKFNAMPLKNKVIAASVIFLLAFAIIGININAKSKQKVSLFPTALDFKDVEEMSREIQKMGLECEIPETKDQIFVAPDKKAIIASQLLEKGYPRRKPPSASSPGGIGILTTDDKRYQRNQSLQYELETVIMGNPKISSAKVLIVMPEDGVGSWGDEKDVRASVNLKVIDGQELSRQQVDGMKNMISGSVEGLSPEKVVITDQDGNLLPKGVAMNEDGLSNDQFSLQGKISEDYQRKAQAALDQIFGEKKTKVTVNVSLDFKKMQSQVTDVGGPGESQVTVSEKSQEEKYNDGADSNNGATPISFNGKINDDKSKYQQGSVIKNTDYDKSVTVIEKTQPEIARITATVIVDNFNEKTTNAALETVKGTIGYNELRGDSISFVSVPFMTDPGELIPGNGPATNIAPPNPYSKKNDQTQWMLYMLFPVVVLMMIAGVFFLRQRRVQIEQTQKMLERIPATTSNNIADLLMDKTGRSTDTNISNPTRVNKSKQQLENIARNNPTKVAEMLKSTWLVDKNN